MNGLVADNFAVATTGAGLRRSLEEAIVGNIATRHLKRYIEILRVEKALFVRGAVSATASALGRRPPSLAGIICIAAVIHRLRRLAGYLPTSLAAGGPVALERVPRRRAFPVVNVV
jgi:hypothetical protein